MPKSTAIKSGFNWEQKFSDLYSTALDVGKQYTTGRISQRSGEAIAEATERTTRAEAGLSTEKMKMFAFMAVAVVAVFIAYKLFRKAV